MARAHPQFETRFARDDADIAAAQRLRYEVFVRELGGGGAGVDHDTGRETDKFDAVVRHLMLFDRARPAGDDLVGVYRLIDAAGAERAGGFYSASEYDLAPLLASGRPLFELGRSCLHRDYRGGAAMHHLWHALGGVLAAEPDAVLFGVASFHGTDAAALAGPLSLLHHDYLAPPSLRPVARDDGAAPCDWLPRDAIDRKAALRAIPALIKAYLRLGGKVGEGAFVDLAFNTTDVCLVLDLAAMTPEQRRLYARPAHPR